MNAVEVFEDGYLFCSTGSVIHVSEAIYGRIDGGNHCGGDANACESRKSTMSIFNHILLRMCKLEKKLK